MRQRALKILQDETGSFEETSRLRDDVLDAMEEYALLRQPGVITWADFNDIKPNCGDLIILRFPPEAMMAPIITVYGVDTEWIDGDVYAVIKPCLISK